MRLLARFAIVLLLLGLGIGFVLRQTRGPLRGALPWAIALAAAPLHALFVLVRGLGDGVATLPLLLFAGASLLLLVGAVAAAGRAMGTRPRWSAVVPLGHALLQAALSSALGAPFSAAGVAPPGLGSAFVVGLAIVVLGAWWVWAPVRPTGAGFGPLMPSDRLRS